MGRSPVHFDPNGQAGGVHFTPRSPNKITKYYYYIKASSRALIYTASHAIIQVIVPNLPIVQFPKQRTLTPFPPRNKASSRVTAKLGRDSWGGEGGSPRVDRPPPQTAPVVTAQTQLPPHAGWA